MHDVSTFEWMAWAPLLALIVVLGVYPDMIFSLTDAGVTKITRVFGG